MPTSEDEKILEFERWTTKQRRKSQSNEKAIVTFQYRLASEQLKKVSPFISTKELWDKLIEMNKGIKDSKIVKGNFLINQMQNFTMKEGETVI